LQDEDVWSLGYEFQHGLLHDRFRGLSGSVLRRLFHANAIDLGIISLLALVELLAGFSVPVLLQQLLRSMEDSESPKSAAITYAAFSLAARLIASQTAVLNLWFSRRSYERSRGELITMIYEKTLTRKIVGALPPSSKAAESASMGKVINHMRFGKPVVELRLMISSRRSLSSSKRSVTYVGMVGKKPGLSAS
jgi:hypothetical protein